MSINVLQPFFESSEAQLEHHGAQKCTTVTPGDLIASATFSSTESIALARAIAARPNNMRKKAVNFIVPTAKLKSVRRNWHAVSF